MQFVVLLGLLLISGGMQWLFPIAIEKYESSRIPDQIATATVTSPTQIPEKLSVERESPKSPEFESPDFPVVVTTAKPTSSTTSPIPNPSAPTTSTSTTSTPSEPVSEVDFGTAIEIEILTLINKEREEHALSALTSDTKLAAVARGHSVDMLQNTFFDHTNQEGCDAGCRLKKADYGYRSYGENIYMMKGYALTAENTAKKIVDGWMNSPGHRANILGKSYTHGGIGVAVEGKAIYATSLFSLPR